LWKELKDSDSPEDFEDFLAAFPESKLAPVARIKLKRIKRKQAKAKAEEQQLAVEEKRQEEERKQLEAEKQKIAEAKRKAEKTLAEEAKLQSDSSLILTLSNPVQKTIIRNSKHPKGNVEITYSVWIKPDHYTGYGSPAMSVIDVGCCRTNSRSSLLLHANKNSASIHYVAHGNDIGLRNANIPYDKWSHVILVKKGTKIRVYIDGEYRADGQIKRGQNVTSNNIYIGHSPQGEVFRGKLKDIKIWDREFSAAEIDSHQSKPTEAQPGTVIDQATGLMWQKKSDGTKRNWDAAKSYCSNLTFGGYSDWELPSKEVLEDMLEKKDLFDPFRRGDWYWSSSSGVGFASYAWSVSFGYGNVISTHPNGSYYARCVRGGQ
jgi:type II secretory pathway pseudopilin PulG